MNKLKHQHQQSWSIFGNRDPEDQRFFSAANSPENVLEDKSSQNRSTLGSANHSDEEQQKIILHSLDEGNSDKRRGSRSLHQRQSLIQRSASASQKNDKDMADKAFNDILTISQFSVDNIEQPQLSDDDNSSQEEEDMLLDNFIESRMEEEMTESSFEEDKKPFKKPLSLPPIKKRKTENVVKVTSDSNRSVFKELTENIFEPVSEFLTNCKELGFLIVFREGYTQFRDTSTLGSGFGSPEHIIVRIVKENDDVEFVKVKLWAKSLSKGCKMYFWQQFIVKNKARKLVFDGKALLNSVLSVYPDERLPDNLRLIDPIVGCWLLRPDNPINTFSGALTKLLANSGVHLSHLGQNNESSIVQQMELLSSMCRQLYGLLHGQDTWPLFYQLEMRVLPALVMMERNGVFVDRDKLQSLGHKLERKMNDLQTQAVSIIGRKFNLASPKQVKIF